VGPTGSWPRPRQTSGHGPAEGFEADRPRGKAGMAPATVRIVRFRSPRRAKRGRKLARIAWEDRRPETGSGPPPGYGRRRARWGRPLTRARPLVADTGAAGRCGRGIRYSPPRVDGRLGSPSPSGTRPTTVTRNPGPAKLVHRGSASGLDRSTPPAELCVPPGRPPIASLPTGEGQATRRRGGIRQAPIANPMADAGTSALRRLAN